MLINNLDNYLSAFIVSSSFLVFFISLLYITYSYHINVYNSPDINDIKKLKLPMHYLPFGLFLMFGIFGIINYIIITNYNECNSILVGLIFGLTLSLIGRYKYNYPIDVFKFDEKNASYVHLAGPIIYSTIFRFILTPLQKHVILNQSIFE
jgi:hypothetical protein